MKAKFVTASPAQEVDSVTDRLVQEVNSVTGRLAEEVLRKLHLVGKPACQPHQVVDAGDLTCSHTSPVGH